MMKNGESNHEKWRKQPCQLFEKATNIGKYVKTGGKLLDNKQPTPNGSNENNEP